MKAILAVREAVPLRFSNRLFRLSERIRRLADVATSQVRGTLSIPQPDAVASTDFAALDRAVRDLGGARARWAEAPVRERAALLDRVLEDTVAAASGWVADACHAKGLTHVGERGEEMLSGPVLVVRNARLLRDSLRDIERSGRPRFPGPVRPGPDGRMRVGVFPASPYDRVLFTGLRAEVWMRPGVTREQIEASQAWAYRAPIEPRVALVLAAGNVASLGPRDALYKLFVEKKAVLLKCNPVNDYLAPHWEKAFAAMIRAGVLRIVRGGAAEGAHLTRHPGIDEIHITGSDKTHDAIVFGPGEDGARRKAAGERQLDKPITSELGNVSPIIVVPGEWSDADIAYQADQLATSIVHNAGFNCLTTRVIVTHAGWPQREAFLSRLKTVLGTLPTRAAYYPGAADRHHTFLEQHPDAAQVGAGGEGRLPWTLITGLDSVRDDVCFTTEAFCGLTAETALPESSGEAFVDAAVDFCNERLWGTLSGTILAHPRSLRDQAVGPAVQRAVARLRYGSVGLNAWHALSFLITSTTWGAYPGHTDTDIQSGRDIVANTYMFSPDTVEKSVVRGPFKMRPTPPWFATRGAAGDALADRLLRFEASPSPGQVPGLIAAALRR
jgi:acyl-CoA reductase-like NAD-dependent aldehyde dehydrogenase